MPARTFGQVLIASGLSQILEMMHVPARPAGRRRFSRVDQLLEDSRSGTASPTVNVANAVAAAHTNDLSHSNWSRHIKRNSALLSVPAGDGFLRKMSGRCTTIGKAKEES